jgi:hypothetical protein
MDGIRSRTACDAVRPSSNLSILAQQFVYRLCSEDANKSATMVAALMVILFSVGLPVICTPQAGRKPGSPRTATEERSRGGTEELVVDHFCIQTVDLPLRFAYRKGSGQRNVLSIYLGRYSTQALQP